jgi:hypothetical protein
MAEMILRLCTGLVRSQEAGVGSQESEVRSQVRGCFFMFAHLLPPQHGPDPSPVPLRLVKAPVAGHPLPRGEGKDPIPWRRPSAS